MGKRRGIQTVILMVIELINYACMHARAQVSSRDVVLILGGNRGRRHVAARVAAIVPLCLSWLSFSLRLSLLLVFLLQTLSLFLLVGFLECRTAGKRQTGVTGSVTTYKL